MPYVRQNVWELGSDWNDTVLWYARGVAEVNKRAIADRTSWRFFAAIHGINPPLWEELGYLQSGEPLASQGDQDLYWKQCQHQSWYFLPWHRGYVLAIEALVRAAIVGKGGPSDWAMPYWNYSKANESDLPPAFASANWPDGQGDNPLFIPQRYGPNNDGNVFIPQNEINLDALGDPDFTGTAGGGSPGFGGVETGFSHEGNVNGDIESQPHNMVHVLIGGQDDNTGLPGLMSDPDTAAIDPIFWLHHCNIDRLWEVWRRNPPAHIDPTDPSWLGGPAASGQRKFAMPNPDGSEWDYTPAQMSDLSSLDYTYDDVSAPAAVPSRGRPRLLRLGATESVAAAATEEDVAKKTVELLGANEAPLRLGGSAVETDVRLESGVAARVTESLEAAPQTGQADRVYLNLENIRGLNDAAAFHVYVSPPDGDGATESSPERLAGSIALFGVKKASRAEEAQAGNGLTYVLDITDIIDDFHLGQGFDPDALKVRIVPRGKVRDSDQITVDRVSVYREGQ